MLNLLTKKSLFVLVSYLSMSSIVGADVNRNSELSIEQRLLEIEQLLITKNDPQIVSAPIKIGLSALFAAGSSSVDNEALGNLQAGGHDANKNGFTVQNVELTLSGTVDTYLDGQSNIIILIDEEGENVVELEEAFLLTRGLPWGLQIKAGQYFTEFGRQNKQHPHTWAFVDQPVVLSRFFGGDGLRSQGLRVSALLPTDWYSEVYFGMQNAKGETVSSFLNVAGEDVAGFTMTDRQANGAEDFLYSMRWLNAGDLSDNTSMNFGISALWGPNASGMETDTRIVGADFYLKWLPDSAVRGYPFVAWHSEVLSRRYEAADVNDVNHQVLNDEGLFTQVLWGFKQNWVAAVRMEYATADGDTSTDPTRDTRKRFSTNVTWHMSEYSKLRLQYNRDDTEHLAEKTADSIWLQVEFNLGSHKAHSF